MLFVLPTKSSDINPIVNVSCITTVISVAIINNAKNDNFFDPKSNSVLENTVCNLQTNNCKQKSNIQQLKKQNKIKRKSHANNASKTSFCTSGMNILVGTLLLTIHQF